MKRKRSTLPGAREMRQAVCYDRLARKASIAGNRTLEAHYSKRSADLKRKVYARRNRKANKGQLQ